MFNYFTSHWAKTLDDLIDDAQSVVLITVVKVEGSAPRSSTSRMLVLKDRVIETIGGGNLELQVISLARRMLDDQDKNDYRLELYGLGPALQQCCGGAVTIAFEKIQQRPKWLTESRKYLDQADCILVTHYGEDKATREFYKSVTELDKNYGSHSLIEKFNPLMPDVVVFGAGHVGSALVNVLAGLPFKIHWVDERSELFPQALPDNVRQYSNALWVELIKQLPDDALNIVMTHSHELDEDICFEYLNKKAFYFLGLIGSKTKRARFLHRLRDRGIAQEQLNRLICPIGVSEVTGNSPPEIAIGVAAQLLSVRDKIKLDNALNE